MPLLRAAAPDPAVLDLLVEAGANIEHATVLLRDLITDYPERAQLETKLVTAEREGDRITHDVIHRLRSSRRRRSALDPADGHVLATTLDDIVDFAEHTASTFRIYAVEAPMEQATVLAGILVDAGAQVAAALRALQTGSDNAPQLVEIHRLENEGDRVSRDALASLFAEGIDPMVVIRWKDIFESLEASVDACESVAHVLEGIALRRR